MYAVVLGRAAAQSFGRAPASLQKKLDRCFIHLANDPRRHNNIKPPKGRFSGYLRFRVGEFRVIYRIDDVSAQVVIIDIADRKDAYE